LKVNQSRRQGTEGRPRARSSTLTVARAGTRSKSPTRMVSDCMTPKPKEARRWMTGAMRRTETRQCCVYSVGRRHDTRQLRCKEKTDFAGTCREVKNPAQEEEASKIMECLAAI
jgi:hypothetical protein